MMTLKRNFAPVLLALSAALFTACGDKPADMIASARQYLEKDDAKAAIIELKTVLQKTPDLAEARFLLGKALLASGDAPGAVLELGKAAELRYDENEVAPHAARECRGWNVISTCVPVSVESFLAQCIECRKQFSRTACDIVGAEQPNHRGDARRGEAR